MRHQRDTLLASWLVLQFQRDPRPNLPFIEYRWSTDISRRYWSDSWWSTWLLDNSGTFSRIQIVSWWTYLSWVECRRLGKVKGNLFQDGIRIFGILWYCCSSGSLQNHRRRCDYDFEFPRAYEIRKQTYQSHGKQMMIRW